MVILLEEKQSFSYEVLQYIFLFSTTGARSLMVDQLVPLSHFDSPSQGNNEILNFALNFLHK